MFTGIIEEMGKVKSIIRGRKSIRLAITCDSVLQDTKIGDSLAINGICLTVTDLGSGFFTADVMPETIQKTNLHTLKVSSPVNLERALQLSDRLGGHLVSGHVDGTGIINQIKKDDNAIRLTIGASEDILKYVVQKGSVAIDGTSLTVTKTGASYFEISLIPLTQGVTTLGIKKAGDLVNIECDIIGKYIEKLIKGDPTLSHKGLTEDTLKSLGYS